MESMKMSLSIVTIEISPRADSSFYLLDNPLERFSLSFLLQTCIFTLLNPYYLT
jgi:hypothetical protein